MSRDMRQFLALSALTVLMACLIVNGEVKVQGMAFAAFLLGWLLAPGERKPVWRGDSLDVLRNEFERKP